jgi:hypothetical protein
MSPRPPAPPRAAARAAAFTALVAGALAGCGDALAPDAPPRDLDAARQRWARTRPAAYEFTVERLCFCVPWAVTLTVRDGVVVDARDPASGAPVAPRPQFTVDSLFAHLDDAVARGAASVSATYDARRGYPVSTFVDYNTGIADEELGYAVRDFAAR